MNWEDWNEDEEKRVIPKIPGNRFLMENWNAGFCACFGDTPRELLKMHIIGCVLRHFWKGKILLGV